MEQCRHRERGVLKIKAYKLPDISSRYNLYTKYLLTALSSSQRDWGVISVHINSLNTLLTSRYTIPISTELYNERTMIGQTRSCQHCIMKENKIVIDVDGNESKEYFEVQSKIPEIEINILKVKTTIIEKMISEKEFNFIWECSKCHNTNSIEDTPISSREWGSNATHGVIWNQPIRTFANRSQFDSLNMEWVTVFLQEIEMGLMAFQDQYFVDHGYEMKETIIPFSHEG